MNEFQSFNATNPSDRRTYFCLYSCCIPVKGFKRSTLCDVQRDSYILIPTEILELILDLKIMSVDSLLQELENDTLIEWLDRIVENGYGFYTHDKDLFSNLKSINLDYEEPKWITNAILDIDPHSNHNIEFIFCQLSDFLCEAIEIRFFYPEDVEGLKWILSKTKNTTFRSVEVLVADNPSFNEKAIEDLFSSYLRLNKLTLHSSKENSIKEVLGNKMLVRYEESITSENHCGMVTPGLFSSNLFLFLEGQKNNSCLNRKIAIDKHGNIKNCPSMTRSYGKVGEVTFSDVINTADFQEVWSISKNTIEICQDCEFRLMCQDCRAYLKEAKNKFSKPLKCNYNPYLAVWE